MTDGLDPRTEEILKDFIELKPLDKPSFLKVKETLTRIGVASLAQKKLYPSCHILHKRGRYFLCSFKELFILDGKESNFSDEDRARRNTIANLLVEWGLINLLDPQQTKSPVAPLSKIKVLSYKEKNEWVIEKKYHIGAEKQQFRKSSE